MTLEQMGLLQNVALPLVASAAEMVSKLIAGTLPARVALAELRGIFAVATQRLDEADKGFDSRDAAENERVAALATLPSNPLK